MIDMAQVTLKEAVSNRDQALAVFETAKPTDKIRRDAGNCLAFWANTVLMMEVKNALRSRPEVRIQLKNVKVYNSLSQETCCHTASVWVNGVRAFTSENNGRGGANLYRPEEPFAEKINLLRLAESYAKSLPRVSSLYFSDGLPMCLDLLVGGLIEAWWQDRQSKRAAALSR